MDSTIYIMKKVTGIGGVFFKCKDPQKVNDWYKNHLGIETSQWGTSFDWRDAEDPNKKGSTAWSTFPDTSKYFDPSGKDFMINYRVENIEALVEQLKTEGVTVLDAVEDSDFGKFVHIMDVEGNKVQLWEPKDEE
jgi:predicted enzyme related to lactoylglutathione lyase